MNKVIGIISYLPDDEIIREKRKKLLISLVSKLDEIFNLPIIIVAQNYHDFKLNSKNCEYHFYPKLGITGARKMLREIFLKSHYEYLIMLDDDCAIFGNRNSGNQYIKEIDDNPGMFYEFNSSLLKLFAIHRDILEQQDFRDVNPETGDAFEDRLFVNDLRIKFPEKRFILQVSKLREESISTKDPLSTWYTNQDIKEMLENTMRYMG